MSISIDIARRILEASKQRARELRSPVSIAIVDSGGHLVLFERMMSPYGWATGNMSIAKASTAVMFNQPTDSVAQWGAAIPGFASSMSEMTNGKFIMSAGGWPIRINGATIGGIGVSGGNAPGRDDEIARAGLTAAEPPRTPQPPQQQQQAYIPPQQPAYSGLGQQSPSASHYARGAAPQQAPNYPAQSPVPAYPVAPIPVPPITPEQPPRDSSFSESSSYKEQPGEAEPKFTNEQGKQERFENEETGRPESPQYYEPEQRPNPEKPGDQS
ncbi:GlcG/HbpS family heme-binding protein [Ktedonospora formicarum]|uniref:Heme-binding protein n=1 Tax=Ktedonospora formicarum TaxID=2778364 RepID=A0A8J3MSA7_9CHLR|nr:heme-binding protein [Ktedonospora formicarum]GHO44666.1 hypothetical protein KSX_28290 [Ktedonospora formicarum]